MCAALTSAGAASGIGRRTVKLLLEKGCFVYAVDLNENALKQLYEAQANVRYLCVNVTNIETLRRAREQVELDGRRVFAVINWFFALSCFLHDLC